MQRIIINADDFGLDESRTKAIKEAFDKNLISSTTMVANGEAYELAVQLAKNELDGKVGIHFNLTEGRPLSGEILSCKEFVYDGVFHGKIDRNKSLGKRVKEAVYKELTAQVERLLNDGVKLTHVDSHHHVHTCRGIYPIVLQVCNEHGLNKIRIHRNIGRISLLKKIYKKLFNFRLRKGGFITTKYFGSIEDVGFSGVEDTTEIMVHPDYNQDGEIIDKVYIDELPTGQNLECAMEKLNCTLVGYKDL